MAVVGVAVAQVGVGDGNAKPPKQMSPIFPSRGPNEALGILHLSREKREFVCLTQNVSECSNISIFQHKDIPTDINKAGGCEIRVS